jgi:hypothetical protein
MEIYPSHKLAHGWLLHVMWACDMDEQPLFNVTWAVFDLHYLQLDQPAARKLSFFHPLLPGLPDTTEMLTLQLSAQL